MKKLYSILAVAAISASAFSQTTVNYVMGNQGWVNSQVISSGTMDSNLSFTTAKNTANTAPTYYTADSSLRLYFASTGNGNSFTITPANGKSISSVTINTVAGYAPTLKYSIDGGTAQTATATTNTYTISGITATSSFMFQNASTATQLRITSISVTYNDPMAVSDAFSVKKSLVKNTMVDGAINFGAKSEVKITNMNGQTVKSASVENGTTMDVSNLAKGMYIVSGVVNGEKVSQKIIKK